MKNAMNLDELQASAKKVAELQEWLDVNGYGRQPKLEPKVEEGLRQTMADHEIVWTFDRDMVRAEARCNASPDAPCRNLPECNCEEWDNEQRDEQGYFHTVEQFTALDEVEEVKHRHTEPSDCNTCTWLNESEILECTNHSFTLELGVTPITPLWQSPGYDWEPAS